MKIFMGLLSLNLMTTTAVSCTNVQAKQKEETQTFTTYIVVYNKDLQRLSEMVNNRLTGSYKLVGGIEVDELGYYQAMAK